MIGPEKFIVGTSGYSFKDWVGPFYPPGTKSGGMFDLYVKQFAVVEINFTFYSMPFPRTLESLARRSPPGFEFWVKVNQEITHKGNLAIAQEFIDDLSPLCEHNKIAGLLLQFPQSFHRTPESRAYLGKVVDAMRALPLAAEFRHQSWDHPDVREGLRERNVTLVVPDEPDLPNLYHPAPTATSSTAYLRLHTRDKSKWYAGDMLRYDYNYSDQELKEVVLQWQNLGTPVEKVYAFFNNCHGGHAAQNAQALRRLLGQVE